HKVGQIHFAVGDADTTGRTKATLQVYQPVRGTEFFIPFMDATAPAETYGAGRYLDPEAMQDGKLLVDFNLAYNPYCAYNELWSCPIPPRENRLKVPIQAGEKKPTGDWVPEDHK